MSFSKEWESIYSKNEQMSIWPWSDLVQLVMRHARPNGQSFNVLEVGVGAGANIPFFKSLDVNFYGVDGSPTIVNSLIKKYPELSEKLKVADFTKELPFDEKFDLIVDRASLTHNSKSGIRSALSLIKNALKENGCFIGIDWWSPKFSEMHKGTPLPDDSSSRTNFTNSRLEGIGVTHFADKADMLDLLSDFKIELLEHKTIKREIPDDGWCIGAWNFVVKKK